MTFTTANPRAFSPDETFVAREIVPDALIWQLTTIAGAIEGDAPAVRVPYVKADPSPGFVAEGEQIDESAPTLDEILVKTGKIATLMKQSNESARSSSEATSVLSASLTRSVITKADTALLANDPLTGGPEGLLTLTGIQDGGTLGTNLDEIADAITLIEAAGGTATNIVTDPATWGHLRKMKIAADSNVTLLGDAAVQTQRTLYGMPVNVTAAMTEGTILIIDSSQIISSVGPIRLEQSEHAYFDLDAVGRRVTWRIGWNVVRPERLAKIAVTLPIAE
ncbi:phage major capsid protein [Flaviflexus huanghaiensis]|uniref:phage major capsid protein n=1 Tax=Flaviflexus huanghaiensis TaxID=1111473 RepID=UPI0015F89C76|nr:phage major capsid protein [Flaviflexus huanghaiensis]